MCLQKLPTASCDGLLRPEELVGGLAICEATAEVISRGCCHSKRRPFTIADRNHQKVGTFGVNMILI